jgi:hypothetical protein
MTLENPNGVHDHLRRGDRSARVPGGKEIE